MAQIETWSRLPQTIRDHLVERMRDRKISLDDLNQLRIWIDSKPDAPEGVWYKDFGSFKNLRRRKISEDVFAGWAGGRGPKALGARSFGPFKVQALHQRAEPSSARTSEDARPHIDEC